jgi:uncharacterized protein YyaL (SSP411 family)
MTVFLTPDQEPFFAGTYFPPGPHGRPASGPARAHRRLWSGTAPARARRGGRQLLRENTRSPPACRGRGGDPQGRAQLARGLRRALGRLRRAPKFPPSGADALLRATALGDAEALRMAARTLDGWRAAACTTSRRRLPPLLGGRALARAALREDALRQRAARARVPGGAPGHGDPFFRGVAETPRLRPARDDVAGGRLLLRDRRRLRGEEGKFFVWTPAEVREALGDAEAHALVLRGLRRHRGGELRGHNIPNLPRPLDEVARELGVTRAALDASLAASRARLYEARAGGCRPPSTTRSSPPGTGS